MTHRAMDENHQPHTTPGAVGRIVDPTNLLLCEVVYLERAESSLIKRSLKVRGRGP